MSILDKINPERYLGGIKYKMLWERLFETTLNGVLSHILFYLLMFAAVIIWFRMRNLRLTILMLGLATFIIFGDGVVSFFRFLF